MPHIVIPYTPRVWGEKFHSSFDRFLALILHRRAGKTTAVLNHHVRAAVDDGWENARLKYLRPDIRGSELEELVRPPGGRHYGHVMPTRVQAKAVAWDKLKHYAGQLGKANEAELKITFKHNGSKVQLFGADDPDSMRGPAFSGLSFDEYSQQPSNIYSEVLSKALADHLGWAAFAGTIKGKDHLYRTYKAGLNTPGWFTLWQDVDRSIATESGITIQLLKQAMSDDRAQILAGIMSQEEFDQEWFLSLEAAIKGAVYMKELSACRKAGRIRKVEYDPDFVVNTAWDLGSTDDTAIWWYQNIGDEIHVLDSWAMSGGKIEEFVDGERRPGSITEEILKRPYKYGRHWLPHDAKAKTLAANGKSIVQMLAYFLGISSIAIVPDLSVVDGIQAARAALSRTWFDEEKCEEGLNALIHYRYKYDQKTEAYAKNPLHDWSSHRSDSFRYLAIAERRIIAPKPPESPDERQKREIGIIEEMIRAEREKTVDELWAEAEQAQMRHQRI